MKKISIIAAALALGVPATAYATADCCKDMKKGGDHAGHDMSADHAGRAPAQPR
jgi:hypothetical protein